jgi:hypothetical protein
LPAIDPSKHEAEREAFFARLDELGEPRVRHLLSVCGFPHGRDLDVVDWLNRQQLAPAPKGK